MATGDKKRALMTDDVNSAGEYGVLSVNGKGVNLLDNGQFSGGGSQLGGGRLPVNARGLTSYDALGYTIDRWTFNPGTLGGTVALDADGLTLTSVFTFDQLMEDGLIAALAGKTVTLSVLAKCVTAPTSPTATGGFGIYSGAWYGQTGLSRDPSEGMKLYAATFPFPSGSSARARIYTTAGGVYKICAVKLELGGAQTLARQSGGAWQLSDPPLNFGLEQLKCQLSKADSYDTYANKTISFT